MTLYDLLYNRVLTDYNNECWSWPGSHNSNGYPHIHFEDRQQRVHRIAYELRYLVLIPLDKECDHTCDNKWCWNPQHIRLVSHRENLNKPSALNHVAANNKQKEYCIRGHPFSEENTRISWEGGTKHRRCKTCVKTFYERKRLEHRKEQHAQTTV